MADPPPLAPPWERLAEPLRSEEDFRGLAEAVPHQLWTANAQGALTFVNQRAVDYFGTPKESILGDGWPSLLHPEDVVGCRALWAHSLETGDDYEVEFRLRHASGVYRWHLGRAHAARGAQGEVLKWFGTNTDIDEAKRIREKLEESKATEQELRNIAVAANRTKDEFLAMLGHELRNPLAPICATLQLMRLRSGDVLVEERALIERQVQHLTQLVDDLLDVSRITRGRVELNRRRLNLAGVVADAVETVRPLFDQRRHRLVVTVPPEGLVIEGDELRLRQVLSNLLTNAAKYTEPGGHIEVEGRVEGAEIVLDIRDDGIGLDPEILARAFDLFVQEQQSLERARGGLGLGLAIVRSLVGLHGGTVSVASEGRGRGSEFTLRLPRAAPAPAASSPDSPPATAPAPPVDRRKVFIVDDNVDAAEVLAEMLGLSGHEVRIAFDAASALLLLDGFQPDVAILDIGLPVVDGYALAAQLRKLPAFDRTRLVALTGYGQESDRRRSREAGFDAHLIKPFRIDQLEAVIALGRR